MGQSCIFVNLDKKEFVNPHNFKRPGENEAASAKICHICVGTIAGVLPFLLSTSAYYGFMGSWANDRIVVLGDESLEFGELYDEICKTWHEITVPLAIHYFEMLDEAAKDDLEDAQRTLFEDIVEAYYSRMANLQRQLAAEQDKPGEPDQEPGPAKDSQEVDAEDCSP